MPELYVVRSIYETTRGGLFGTVALPDGRVWVLHGRRLAVAAPEVEPVERVMTADDVDVLESMGVIDGPTALRQALRLLR